MGSPAHPDAEQTAELEAAGKLQEVGAVKGIAIVDGEVRLEQVLPGESVSLYEVSW
jgi:hypothetical protein